MTDTMQPTAFVDASAIVALVDRNDRSHEAAIAAYRGLQEAGYRLFTTNLVLAEVVQLLTDGIGAEVARQFLRDQRLTIYHALPDDEARAMAMVMSSRSTRGLSYTDAVSLVVMEKLGISDAFVVDTTFLSEAS
ncbi:MAG: PIN domain-containing protein [Thermomicrobiales bacterium]|nr:PIN domain-containing protein [Thermomicrobiales bacterium]MCO5218544.1 PIN domain-containing protein [Thermomicrobiales bacterium]MCO5224834.1 PIN domain-containing protein [Thermomicrobiales bacterium]MCO5227648.1 PIN domain-containing protein [Thermomicrobiales bacterium]